MFHVLSSFSVVYSDCKLKNKKQDTDEINTNGCIIIFRNLNFSFRFVVGDCYLSFFILEFI